MRIHLSKQGKIMKTVPLIGLILCFGHATTCYAASGQEIWMDQCARCHGPDGKAGTPMGRKLQMKDLANAKVQAEMKDDAMIKASKDGKQASDGTTLMRPAKNVTNDDIKALMQVVRGFKP